MEYYRLLQLGAEPFSTSPDHRMLYPSAQVKNCLRWLQIGVRLQRGLHVVTGGIGVGKTILCRALLNGLNSRSDIISYLMLDPGFDSVTSFLRELYVLFIGNEPNVSLDDRRLKEILKRYVFSKAINENKNLVLVIDEAQKLSKDQLEVLRELLNYETNDKKLLQIVLFGQPEFSATLDSMPNLRDRINKAFVLTPFSKKDTDKCIHFRLRKVASSAAYPQFSPAATSYIHRLSKGYPRRIIAICHEVMLLLAITKEMKVSKTTVIEAIGKNRKGLRAVLGQRITYIFNRRSATVACASLLIVFLIAFSTGAIPQYKEKAFGLVSEVSQDILHIARTKMVGNTPEIIVSSQKHTVLAADEKNSSEVVLGYRAKIENLLPVEITPHTVAKSIANDVQKQSAEKQRPALLGEASVPRHASISYLIRLVYGDYSAKLLHDVLDANPQLFDPNNIPAGTRIKFPVRNLLHPSQEALQFIVVAAEEVVLQNALDVLKKIKHKAPEFRLYYQWSSESGLQFCVAMQSLYPTRAAAQQAMNKVSNTLQRELFIIPAPNSENIYTNIL
jgi:general secretion pathway protein A